tara:strand:+ start:117 stop:1007 length:891 start_codon:yes stop_codon:yes gene_type:complete
MKNTNNTMLFFRTVADEANVDGIDDQLCVAASRFVSMNPASATTLELNFHSLKNNVYMHNENLTYDKVILTITQGDMEEVMETLVSLFNSNPHSDGFMVVADDCTITDSAVSALANLTIPAVYAHSSITGVASITVADYAYYARFQDVGLAGVAPTAIAAGALAVNTHYTNAETAAKAYTIPSAVAGKAGDWITVTYIANIANTNLHSYTTTTDAAFAPGSMIRVQPNDATRVAVVDVATTNDNIVKITGLTNGDGGIGTTIRFVNKTGTTNGWAVDAVVLGQGAQSAASATTVFA